jgi:hypothetical protein
LEAAIAISHEFLTRAQVNDAYRYVAWLQKVPWFLIELLVVMKLPKGVTGAKGRGVFVGLMEGLRAGRPFATLILMAVMYVLPSAAAEMAMESNFEGMDGAGRAFSRAQQEDRMLKKNHFGSVDLGPFLDGRHVPPVAGDRCEGTKHDCEANGCCDAGAMHYVPDEGGS